MKTMMNLDGTQIVRVSDEEASRLFHDDGFRYIAKSIWKEKVRDVEKEPAVNEETGKTEMVTKKSNKISKAAKRHLKKSN